MGGSSSYDQYRGKAGQRYKEQAANLEAQAKSLLYALRHSYGDALKQKLQNVNEALEQKLFVDEQGYSKRVRSLTGAIGDNAKSEALQSGINASNQIRERNSALSEAMLQGSGESDMLQAQMMSLRNWQANQGEVNRSLYDTLRSVNSSLTDLNVDTKTARVNLEAEALADKELLWTNYYNQRGESWTQLGNIRGQQADYLDMAKEYGVGKGGNTKAAEKAFMHAAKEAGKAWDSPGISDELLNWQGRDPFRQDNNMSKLQSAQTVNLGKRPEGATLREW